MASFPCVHHIEIGVTDGPKVVNMLRKNFTFDVVAARNSKVARQWLLRKHDTRYLVTCLKSTNKELIQRDNYVTDWMDAPGMTRWDYSQEERRRKDSVFNVCLQVDNLDKALERLSTYGVRPVKEVSTVSDGFGSVTTCTVKSCVGDVYHTLVQKDERRYTGIFLPEFYQIPPCRRCCASGNAGNAGDAGSNPGRTSSSSSSSIYSSEDDCVYKDGEDRVSGDAGGGDGLGTDGMCSLCYYNNTIGNDDDDDDDDTLICDDRGLHSNNNNNSSNNNNNNKRRHHSDCGGAPAHTTNVLGRGASSMGDCDSTTWTSFDHVALAVEMGKSAEVIDWYERCFGMKRFLINNEDEDNNGLVLSTDDVGLRLRAMEYWKCAETGMAGPEVDGCRGNRLSFVIAEGLPPRPGSTAINQVESWLNQHGGPGINHIALATNDIKATVQSLKQTGTRFANPPPADYYSEAGRLPDIEKAGEDVEVLRQHGILIDTEANRIYDDGGDQAIPQAEKYLLQIFTEPVLPKDPFFMEVIQRVGATGFGSGNVAALYRSVQASILRKAETSNS